MSIQISIKLTVEQANDILDCLNHSLCAINDYLPILESVPSDDVAVPAYEDYTEENKQEAIKHIEDIKSIINQAM